MLTHHTSFKKRKLDENTLVAGVTIAGGAKLAEFLSDGSPFVTHIDRRPGWTPL